MLGAAAAHVVVAVEAEAGELLNGDKCNDLDPGLPPEDDLRVITGGTMRLDDLFLLFWLARLFRVLGEIEEATEEPPGLRLILTPEM